MKKLDPKIHREFSNKFNLIINKGDITKIDDNIKDFLVTAMIDDHEYTITNPDLSENAILQMMISIFNIIVNNIYESNDNGAYIIKNVLNMIDTLSESIKHNLLPEITKRILNEKVNSDEDAMALMKALNNISSKYTKVSTSLIDAVELKKQLAEAGELDKLEDLEKFLKSLKENDGNDLFI